MTTVPRIYHFRGFRLDAATRKLWQGSQEVTLTHKAFKCLLHLVENHHRAIGRDELIQVIWQHNHLTDNALDQTIFQLRRAFGDTSQQQQFIKTVRGFGYHWAAPVQVEAAGSPAMDEAIRPRRPKWVWSVVAATVGLALILAVNSLWQRHGEDETDGGFWHDGKGDIALVLPATVDADEGDGWIRLGAMALIADRLRSAGQPVVPAETVLVLMERAADQPDLDRLEWLHSTTGAHLLLGAEVRKDGESWHVSLRSVTPDVPALSAAGQANDVLEATRIATDRIALSLGRTPALGLDAEPDLARLVQQLQAFILAGQQHAAYDLVDNAPSALRTHPEVRFLLARLDLASHRLDDAERRFESLLADPAVRSDPALHARILNGLGGVYFYRGDTGATEQRLQQAINVLGHENRPDVMCQILSNLAPIAIEGGDLARARSHLTRARLDCETTGSPVGLADVDHNLGMLELHNERYYDATVLLNRAAESYFILRDVNKELRARMNTVIALMELLDLPAITDIVPRLEELLDQTTNQALSDHVNLVRANFWAASGRVSAADDFFDDLSAALEVDDARQANMFARLLVADRAAQGGDFEQALQLANDVLEAGQHPHTGLEIQLGHAWLILIRAHLALGNFSAAASALVEMADWAASSQASSAGIYTLLARAETAAIKDQLTAARTAFEHAVSLAAASQVPSLLLRATESYSRWLLNDGSGLYDPDLALVVASRVARYADQHYDAALLQLRVAHAMGATVAWRNALTQTQSLAGERQIPAGLRVAPHSI